MIDLLGLLAVIGLIVIGARAVWTRTAPVSPSRARVRFCSECKAEVDEGQRFCGSCGAPASLYPDMELSPEERARIHLEEQERIGAREAVEGPRRRRRWRRFALGVGGALFLYVVVEIVPLAITRIRLVNNPEAQLLYKAAVVRMNGDGDVIRVGELRGFEKVGLQEYKFDVSATYREDTGLVTSGTLVATVRRYSDGQLLVTLTHR